MVWSGNKAPEQKDPDVAALAAWVEDELERFANEQIDNTIANDLRPTFNEPLRPRQGMFAYADGTKWNPGSGEGPYWRNGAGLWLPVFPLNAKGDLYTYNPTTGLPTRFPVGANGTYLSPDSSQATGLTWKAFLLAAGVTMVNGTLVESHASNAVTFAVKTLAGADPSSGDPVKFYFRNATAGTGDFVERLVTGALNITVSSGSTLGFTSGVAARVWIGALDNAGTVELFVVNCLSGIDVYPLGQFPLVTTVAEGGAGAADSAHVAYSATARTAKAYVIVGYASYETGLSTAGTWATSPTRLHLQGPNDPIPGVYINAAAQITGASSTGTTTVPFDNTIPQNTEGTQFLTKSIVATSAANLYEVRVQAGEAPSARVHVIMALFRDSGADAIATVTDFATGGNEAGILTLFHRALFGAAGSTTFNARIGGNAASTITFNGNGGLPGQAFNGTYNSFLEIKEMMV